MLRVIEGEQVNLGIVEEFFQGERTVEEVITRVIRANDSLKEAFLVRGIVVFPKSIKLMNRLGSLYMKQNRFDDAEEVFMQCLAVAEGNSEFALHQLSWISFRKGNKLKAEMLLREACKRFPKSVATIEKLAIINFKLGKLREAQTIFGLVLKMDPENDEAREALKAIRAGGHIKNADEGDEDAVDLNSYLEIHEAQGVDLDDDVHLFELGKKEMTRGDFVIADELFEEALAISPVNFYAAYFSFLASAFLGRKDDLPGKFERMRKIDPKNKFVETVRATMKRSVGSECSEKAIQGYRTGVRKVDKRGKIALSLSRISLGNGDFANARRYLGKAAVMGRNPKLVLDAEVDIFIAEGSLDQAVKMLEEKLSQFDQNSSKGQNILVNLVRVLDLVKEDERILELVERFQFLKMQPVVAMALKRIRIKDRVGKII